MGDVSLQNCQSTRNSTLQIPKAKLVNYGDRAFEVAAPSLWNKLPMSLRNTDNYNSFKKNLKTHLFNYYYNTT